jgi:hypothetical protein
VASASPLNEPDILARLTSSPSQNVFPDSGDIISSSTKRTLSIAYGITAAVIFVTFLLTLFILHLCGVDLKQRLRKFDRLFNRVHPRRKKSPFLLNLRKAEGMEPLMLRKTGLSLSVCAVSLCVCYVFMSVSVCVFCYVCLFGSCSLVCTLLSGRCVFSFSLVLTLPFFPSSLPSFSLFFSLLFL